MTQVDRPYIWEGLDAQQRERLWAAALRWHDQAMARMRERDQQERDSRRQTRQALLPGGAPAARRPLDRCPDCPGGLACGLSDRCPGDAPSVPLETMEQVRHRRCGERLAALIQDHAEQLRPALAEVCRDLLTEELPEAIEVLLRGRL